MKKIFLIIVFLAQVALVKGQKKNVSIRGKFSFLKEQDTLKIEVYKYGYRFADVVKKVDTLKVNHKIFSCKFQAYDNQTYIRIVYPSIDPQFFLVQPGDQVNITNKGQQLIFNGKGAEKYRMQAVINKMELQFLRDHSNSPSDLDSFMPYFKSVDSLSLQLHHYLTSQRRSINKSVYQVLLADIDNYPQVAKYHAIHFLNEWYGKKVPVQYSNIWQKYLAETTDKKDVDVALSQHFTNYIYVKFDADCLLKDIPFNKQAFFDYILNNFKGNAKEKLLVFFLNRFRQDTSGELSKWIDRSTPFILNPDFKAWVTKLRLNTPGAPVTLFSLSDTSGRRHDLAALKGKVVVLDFWFTGCGNCVQLLPYLKKVEKQFASNDQVVFISISTDNNKEMWQKSVKNGTYSSSESINLYTNGQAWDNPLVKQLQVNGAPTLKIIDKEGKLFENPVDCRTDGGKDLINKINRALAKD